MSDLTTPRGTENLVAPDEPQIVRHDDRSLGQLVGEMTTEVSALVRQEIQLARTEIQEEIQKAGGLAQQTLDEARTALRQDLQMAQQELRGETKKAQQAGMAFGAAAVTGLTAVLLIAWTIAWALDEFLPTWAAFLITAVIFGIVAAIAAASGRKRVKQIHPRPDRAIAAATQDMQALRDRARERVTQVNPKPEQTIETVREDMQTIKESRS